MVQSTPAPSKINTNPTQPASGRESRRSASAVSSPRTGRASARVVGEARGSSRDPDRPVMELDFGVVVYPAESSGGVWRAVFTEGGRRRFVQASSEAALAVKLGRVLERLSAGAPNMERSGADLVAWYLDPDRLPVDKRWSRKHAHTPRRLCERLALPLIGTIACQDITPAHMQQVVNAAPTAGEGNRTARLISALAGAGL